MDLRTKRMSSQSHSRILCDALPQLSVHPHQLLLTNGATTPWALLNSLFLIRLEILSPTAVELLTSTDLPSTIANPLRDFLVPTRDVNSCYMAEKWLGKTPIINAKIEQQAVDSQGGIRGR